MLKKLTAVTVLASLSLMILAGCAGPATMDAPGNTTLGSAGMGALGGAAIGAAVDSKNRGAGALIGGAVGAVGGGLVGNQMEKNRNQAYYQQQQVQGAYQAGYQQGSAPPPRSY